MMSSAIRDAARGDFAMSHAMFSSTAGSTASPLFGAFRSPGSQPPSPAGAAAAAPTAPHPSDAVSAPFGTVSATGVPLPTKPRDHKEALASGAKPVRVVQKEKNQKSKHAKAYLVEWSEGGTSLSSQASRKPQAA